MTLDYTTILNLLSKKLVKIRLYSIYTNKSYNKLDLVLLQVTRHFFQRYLTGKRVFLY